MARRSLLGIFAHPDDEVAGFSGSLLKYGEEGVQTAVVCATRGEAGQITAFPRSIMSQMRRELAERGADLRPGGDMATIPLEEMGTPDDRITTVIPLTPQQVEAKLRVAAAHRTQTPPHTPGEDQPPPAYVAWISQERFVLLAPPGAAPSSEHDLFAGVTLHD